MAFEQWMRFDVQFWMTLALGFTMGLHHALDADHVAAVASVVSEHRRLRHSATIGASWGAGHTVTLTAVGLAVLWGGIIIPQTVAVGFEFAVGLMLVGLGMRVGWRLICERMHWHPHPYDGGTHLHVHSHRQESSHRHRHFCPQLGRSFLIGTMHGFAGSAALMLLIVSRIRSPWAGVAYLVVFGLGTLVGMMAVTTVIGVPFVVTPLRWERIRTGCRAAAGLASLFVGCSLILETGRQALIVLPSSLLLFGIR